MNRLMPAGLVFIVRQGLHAEYLSYNMMEIESLSPSASTSSCSLPARKDESLPPTEKGMKALEAAARLDPVPFSGEVRAGGLQSIAFSRDGRDVQGAGDFLVDVIWCFFLDEFRRYSAFFGCRTFAAHSFVHPFFYPSLRIAALRDSYQLSEKTFSRERRWILTFFHVQGKRDEGMSTRVVKNELFVTAS